MNIEMNGKNSNYLDIDREFCEQCECEDPYPYCVYLPVMKIYVDDPGLTTHEFEQMEDAIAEAIGKFTEGRIESWVTQNTTIFPLVEHDFPPLPQNVHFEEEKDTILKYIHRSE